MPLAQRHPEKHTQHSSIADQCTPQPRQPLFFKQTQRVPDNPPQCCRKQQTQDWQQERRRKYGHHHRVTHIRVKAGAGPIAVTLHEKNQHRKTQHHEERERCGVREEKPCD